MITPTTDNRIEVLDVLRGVAILGILLANITSFATPAASEMLAPHLADPSPGKALFDSLTLAFVNGKFRSMLAILFGYGIWLQYEKRQDKGKAWPGGYLKRLLWLFVLGLLHGFLIWYGDILSTYAVIALLAALLVRSKDKTMWVLIGLLALNAFITAVVLVPLMIYFTQSGRADEWDLGAVWPIFTASYETTIFQSGTWLQQFAHRSIYYGIMLGNAFVLGPVILPLFLLGIMFAKARVLECPSLHPKLRKWCLILGFGIGLPLNLIALIPMNARIAESLQVGYEILLGPMLALGYVMLIAMAVEKGIGRWITSALARIGRVALSVYLLQSLACTFVFYSWGLGWFGRMAPWGWLVVVGCVWVLDFAFASVWLRFFRMGPVEWLWRSLTEWKRLGIKVGGG